VVSVPPFKFPSQEPIFPSLFNISLSCSAGLLLPNVPSTGSSWFLAWAGVLTGKLVEFPNPSSLHCYHLASFLDQS
jgi:hypothetical protein